MNISTVISTLEPIYYNGDQSSYHINYEFNNVIDKKTSGIPWYFRTCNILIFMQYIKQQI